MKSKKALMGYAALLILIFHFYIRMFNKPLETFIWQSAYIGVDLFFFLSAISLGRKKEIAFGQFALNRITRVYVPFVAFCVVSAIYKLIMAKKAVPSKVFDEFIKRISFVELFQKGGGAFLWFLPGIMLVYLLVPGLVALKRKFGLWTLLGGLVCWGALAALLQYGFKYTTIFILLNRLPIFLFGLFYDRIRQKEISMYIRIPVTIAVVILGCLLVNKYGVTSRLGVPFKDMYYIIAIPMVLGVAEIFEMLYMIKGFKLRIFEVMGGATLETYGLQMTFGYDIMALILKKTMNNRPVSFLLTVIILVLLALLVHFLRGRVENLFSKKEEK